MALLAFAAFAVQTSFVGTVNAQSGQKTMKPTQATQQHGSGMKAETGMKAGSGMKQGSGMKDSMSRAFTNGFNVPSTGVALEGYCPVCYVKANMANKGKPEFSADHNGITYWFVSDDVRNVFLADPEKYLPAYGGWCATGVAMGQRFPVDPTNFKVVDGQLMLFLKNQKIDGETIWNKDEAGNMKKANANWEKLKG